MTEAEQLRIQAATSQAQNELTRFGDLLSIGADLEALYQAAKPVHEAALGIWTTIVEILRAQQGLPPKGPSDEINLEELFADAGVAQEAGGVET